jgi:hypothetical protein
MNSGIAPKEKELFALFYGELRKYVDCFLKDRFWIPRSSGGMTKID